VRPNLVSVWYDVLSHADCRHVVAAMNATPGVAGGVLRRGQDAVDGRMRTCTEHAVAAAQAVPVLGAMRAVAREAFPLEGAWLKEMLLDGPKYCSYGPGEYFRAHRDRSDDPDDPIAVRTRSLSFVCFLNAAEPVEGLPSFDGGTLVMYVPAADGSIEPLNIRPSAGTIVTFPSDLLHEVRPVRQGIRYSAVAWLHPRGN
jgi:predicted 2-oxoglutarate/Fe(II)-dependent dioxygenase YbiX